MEMIRDRLRRAAQTLEARNVPYAIAGGNAVAAWVSEVEEAAVRNTQDVDVLLRRADFPRALQALTSAGFIHRHSSGLDKFLDGPGAKARDAVHVVFAGERVRKEHFYPAPDVDEATATPTCKVLNLEPLVRMKLTSYRDKDRTHLRDMIDVGLIDSTWVSKMAVDNGCKNCSTIRMASLAVVRRARVALPQPPKTQPRLPEALSRIRQPRCLANL